MADGLSKAIQRLALWRGRPAKASVMKENTLNPLPDIAGVTAALNTFFDALHHGDAKKLNEIFLPDATYCCSTNTQMVYINSDQYIKLTENRPSPASLTQDRRDSILSMEFSGTDTAFVRVECGVTPRFHADFVTLVKREKQWMIISIVFSLCGMS